MGTNPLMSTRRGWMPVPATIQPLSWGWDGYSWMGMAGMGTAGMGTAGMGVRLGCSQLPPKDKWSPQHRAGMGAVLCELC